MATTAELQHEHNRGRAAAGPLKVVDRMLGRWTVPDPTEAHLVTCAVTDAGELAWPPG